MRDKEKDNQLYDLIQKFKVHGISHAPDRLPEVLEFQDNIGRRTIDDSIEFYERLNDDTKEIFEFSCMNCLCRDTAREIIRRCYLDVETGSGGAIEKLRAQHARDLEKMRAEIKVWKDRYENTSQAYNDVEEDIKTIARTLKAYW